MSDLDRRLTALQITDPYSHQRGTALHFRIKKISDNKKKRENLVLGPRRGADTKRDRPTDFRP
jgi:hypothetical protein